MADVIIMILMAVLCYIQVRCVYVQEKLRRRVARLEKRFLQNELHKDAKRSDKDAESEYWQKIADFLNDN